MRHRFVPWAAVLLAACEPVPPLPSPAFSLPVDFSYACEGDDRTVAFQDDQAAADLNATRMCPDLTVATTEGLVTRQGHLFGVVVNRAPAGVSVVQMNPASGARGVLDADRFTPGYSAIPVGDDPIRVVRASNWSSFFVVSAGSREVTRIVLKGTGDAVFFDRDAFSLPGVPGEAWLAKQSDGEDRLYVAAAFEPRLWVFKLGTDPSQPSDDLAPAMTEHALPAVVHRVEPQGAGFVVTWQERPVLSRMDKSGAVLAGEVGIVSACADTLDDDGDGAIDHLDPDCGAASDPDESAEPPLPALPATEPPIWFAGTRSCEDLLDNDGDGLTDTDDPTCTPSAPDGESVPQCGDGLDNDLDGRVDLVDTGCFDAEDRFESGPGLYGPYFPAVVEAGAAGSFVYVLDQPRGRIVVFEAAADGSLVRVTVPAHEQTTGPLSYVPYGGGVPAELGPVTASKLPSLVEAGVTDLLLPAADALSLRSSRVVGELWARSIDPAEGETQAAVDLALPEGYWRPPGCDPAKTDRCWQPPGDADNHYLFAPRQDGQIQLVHSVMRGVPIHRFARHLAIDERRIVVSTPLLSVRGDLVTLGAALKPGYPSLGSFKVEETLAEAETDVSPALERQSGVWPPVDWQAAPSTWLADFDRVPSETWTLTYEGAIPGSSGRLGRLVSEETFYAPGERFCEAGVEVGDTLVVAAAPGSFDPAYRLNLVVVTEDGVSCPLKPVLLTALQLRVTGVGMDTLAVDPATVGRVPMYPEIDEEELAAKGLSLSKCLGALEVLSATDSFTAPALPLDLGRLPRRVEYQVRTTGVWRVQGSLSGFQHPWMWDGVAGKCVKDTALDARHTGRLVEAKLKAGAAYRTCPPGLDQTAFEVMEDVLDTRTRFANWSFRLDMWPGCETKEDGTIALLPTLRDTSWVFTLTGPQSPATLSSAASALSPRLGQLELRRSVVQLDAGDHSVTVIDFTPLDNLGIFSPRFQ
jgi:hypothetical protein